MKILAILGSPKVEGNTATVLELFEKAVDAAHEVERVNIVEKTIHGCKAGFQCQEVFDDPGCHQDDDANGIFERMIAADAVVYASPMFWWGFSAQMKALIDRHICIVKGAHPEGRKSFMQDKPIALLATCGGTIENNTEPFQMMFDKFGAYLRAKVVGKYIVPSYSSDEVAREAATATAARLAADLTRG